MCALRLLVCEHCRTQFEVNVSRRERFCSPACRVAAKPAPSGGGNHTRPTVYTTRCPTRETLPPFRFFPGGEKKPENNPCNRR